MVNIMHFKATGHRAGSSSKDTEKLFKFIFKILKRMFKKK